jgi:hypothetical protein
VKWIDERRGLWMYRPGEPVCERWFVPAALARLLARQFGDVRIGYLSGRRELTAPLAQRFRWTRPMVCWSASAPGANHG